MKQNQDDLTFEVLPLKNATLVLNVINHHRRQQMLDHIHRHGQLTVSSIYKSLGIEQSVASQHLALLRRAGFVCTSRSGRHIYYSVNRPRLQTISKSVKKLLQ